MVILKLRYFPEVVSVRVTLQMFWRYGWRNDVGSTIRGHRKLSMSDSGSQSNLEQVSSLLFAPDGRQALSTPDV